MEETPEKRNYDDLWVPNESCWSWRNVKYGLVFSAYAIGYEAFYTAVTVLIGFLFLRPLGFVEDSPSTVRCKEVIWSSLVVFWFVGVPWLAYCSTQHRMRHCCSFLAAAQGGVRKVRDRITLLIAFLPVVGFWFEPAKDKKAHRDTD